MAACATCGRGKAKRHCPALDRLICPTCCGTKRQVEIRCPGGCGWLQAARAHPHAAQQRQQERDAGLIVPLIRGLPDETYMALIACLHAAVAHAAAAEPRPLDDDLLHAARAVADTADTALRGVLYEHVPESPVAARLARALAQPAAEAADRGVSGVEGAMVEAMRRLEEVLSGFLATRPAAPDAFLEFLARVLRPQLADPTTGQALGTTDPLLAPLAAAPDDAPRILLP